MSTKKKIQKTVDLTGIIIPAAWDDRGNILAVAISTADEKEYLIESRGPGQDLLGLLHKEVGIRGVTGRRAGKSTVEVQEYRLLKSW